MPLGNRKICKTFYIKEYRMDEEDPLGNPQVSLFKR